MNDLSKSIGNQNRYSFWCEAHQQRRFYGVCLWLKDAYDNGRIKPDADHPQGDCATAMCRGNCVAIKMREEELAACKPLYYQEAQIRSERRVEGSVENDESYLRGWNQAGKALGKEERKAVSQKQIQRPELKKSDDVIQIRSSSMADVITEQVKLESDPEYLKNKIIEMKRRVVSIAKTDPDSARKLLMKVKQLEARVSV